MNKWTDLPRYSKGRKSADTCYRIQQKYYDTVSLVGPCFLLMENIVASIQCEIQRQGGEYGAKA